MLFYIYAIWRLQKFAKCYILSLGLIILEEWEKVGFQYVYYLTWGVDCFTINALTLDGMWLIPRFFNFLQKNAQIGAFYDVQCIRAYPNLSLIRILVYPNSAVRMWYHRHYNVNSYPYSAPV